VTVEGVPFVVVLGVFLLLGAAIRRWRLLLVLAALWALLVAGVLLDGGWENDTDWDPEVVAFMATIVGFAPIELAAAIGVWVGRIIRPPRHRVRPRPAAPNDAAGPARSSP
jgi:hypothetical protein